MAEISVPLISICIAAYIGLCKCLAGNRVDSGATQMAAGVSELANAAAEASELVNAAAGASDLANLADNVPANGEQV